MDKLTSPRLHIWALGEQKLSSSNKPAPSAEQKRPLNAGIAPSEEKQERPSRYERFGRGELLYTDLTSQVRDFPDDVAAQTSLYDHRLPIDIELPGRCTTPNGRSRTCKTRRISSESVDLLYDLKTAGYPIRSPEEMPPGSTVQLDLDQIGNFHGIVTAQNADGFQLAVDVDCKGMLIPKLARMAALIRTASLSETPAATKRNVTRIEPVVKSCSYVDHVGLLRKGKIINISPLDALIKAAVIPPIATHIIFSGVPSRAAEVTRTFEIGFAVQFCEPIPDADFSASIKFLDE